MNLGRTVVSAMVLIVVACAVDASAQEVEVGQEGKWRIWYTSPDLRAELDYHWADTHLGDDRILLKLAVSAGTAGGVPTVARDKVRLRTPDGTILELPTQTRFRAIQSSMSVAFRQENAWGPPPARFVGSRERIEEWFYSPQGRTIQRDSIHPTAFRYCSGPLVFEVPGGVQPGEWKLVIDLEETRVEIPFVLGEHSG